MRQDGGGEKRPLERDRQVLPRREPGHRAGVGAPGPKTVSSVSELNLYHLKKPGLAYPVFFIDKNVLFVLTEILKKF